MRDRIVTDPRHSVTTDATLEEIAGDTARRGAGNVRAKLDRAQQIGTKTTPTDMVTAVDLETEHLIRESLLEATPGASIVGEEGTAIKGTSDIGWVVDPIDGTVNFHYGLPVVAVSIAATRSGRVVAGAVVDVWRDELFTARLGSGASMNGRQITTGTTTDLASALIATGFSYSADRRTEEAEVVRRLLPAARDIRCFGSAALHLAWVACGRVDGYWESDVNNWDVAAGTLIAQEAGALVETTTRNGTGSVLASPPALFDALRRLVEM